MTDSNTINTRIVDDCEFIERNGRLYATPDTFRKYAGIENVNDFCYRHGIKGVRFGGIVIRDKAEIDKAKGFTPSAA